MVERDACGGAHAPFKQTDFAHVAAARNVREHEVAARMLFADFYEPEADQVEGIGGLALPEHGGAAFAHARPAETLQLFELDIRKALPQLRLPQEGKALVSFGRFVRLHSICILPSGDRQQNEHIPWHQPPPGAPPR